MPNALTRSRRGRKNSKIETTEETFPMTVTTDAVDELVEQTSVPETEQDADAAAQFEIVSLPAPEDYEPNRKTPGRIRRPSYFDDILKAEHVFAKGWQHVPVSSKEHKEFVLRELNRSKLFLGVGLELDTDHEDAVYYKSRELQKRDRKAADAEGGEGTEASDEATETETDSE